DALLLRPLPVATPKTLVSIFTTDQKNPGFAPSSHLNWKDLRAQNGSFAQVLGYDFAPMSVAVGGSERGGGSAGEPTVLFGQMVSGNYFDVPGVHAALGRTF